MAEWPEQLADEHVPAHYPRDIIERVRDLLGHIGTVGAYSHSQGIPAVRQRIAKFIEARDGHATDPKNIFVTNGASDGIGRILECVITSPDIGVMVPIPQYPLYSATITLNGGTMVPYYMNEENDWSLRVMRERKLVANQPATAIDIRTRACPQCGQDGGQGGARPVHHQSGQSHWERPQSTDPRGDCYVLQEKSNGASR